MTPKEAIFYSEYIKDFNGTRAAMVAGAPEKSAHVAAARMLKRPRVQAAIDAWKQRSCAKNELNAEMVIAKIAAVLRADPKNLYDQDGRRIPVHLLDDTTRAAIAAIEDEETDGPGRVRTVRQKLKFADALRAAELGGKILKMFGESSFSAAVETGAGGLPPDSTIKIVLVRPDAD